MSDYVIKGSVKDTNGNAITNLKIQAMDSDQEFFEDHIDDILGNIWVNNDGTFEIPFDKEQFQDGWLEGNPDIYLMIRNSFGEVIYTTETRRGVKSSDKKNLTFDIIVDSLEKKIPFIDDPYSHNIDRFPADFGRLGEAVDMNNTDIATTFGLLMNTIDAWILYTRPETWEIIGYDGPQVPRYPWKEEHSHKLAWEQK